jgi:hypothetical protein
MWDGVKTVLSISKHEYASKCSESPFKCKHSGMLNFTRWSVGWSKMKVIWRKSVILGVPNVALYILYYWVETTFLKDKMFLFQGQSPKYFVVTKIRRIRGVLMSNWSSARRCLWPWANSSAHLGSLSVKWKFIKVSSRANIPWLHVLLQLTHDPHHFTIVGWPSLEATSTTILFMLWLWSHPSSLYD